MQRMWHSFIYLFILIFENVVQLLLCAQNLLNIAEFMLEENQQTGRIKQELNHFQISLNTTEHILEEKPQKCNEFGKVFNLNSYCSQYWVIYTG